MKLARLLLAALFLAATQVALVHPLEHVGSGSSELALGEKYPVDLVHAQQCDVCVATASLGFVSSSVLSFEPPMLPGGTAQETQEHLFLAAFAPLFRSQAPPTLS
jgi:hypothetical protein